MDVPRTVGYFAGAAVAVAAGLVDPPIGVVIAIVPFIKPLTHSALPVAVRLVGEFLEGASKPIGGDDDAVFELEDDLRREQEAARTAGRVNVDLSRADGQRRRRS
jgi:hypothetical protein